MDDIEVKFVRKIIEFKRVFSDLERRFEEINQYNMEM
jgi:hypothetical protein